MRSILHFKDDRKQKTKEKYTITPKQIEYSRDRNGGKNVRE
jgi:hypothetical protein